MEFFMNYAKRYRSHCAVIIIFMVFWFCCPLLAQDKGSCKLSNENRQFIQKALDDWSKVSRDLLKIDPRPLPWIILFDTSCVWHLAPDKEFLKDAEPAAAQINFENQPVPVYARLHDGKLTLPNGSAIPAKGTAFSSLYNNEKKPFVVVSLLDVWRLNPGLARRPGLADIMRGVICHENVHTRQLAMVAQKVNELKKRYSLPEDISDDIIEERFGKIAEFKAAFETGSDILYEAAAEKNAARRDSLVAKVLKMVGNRKARYYKGVNKPYEELEDLFLNMEGIAVWVTFKMPGMNKQQDMEKGKKIKRAKNSWSQDRGLVLFLLIEKMVSNWHQRVLGPELASPYKLLEEAVKK